MGPFLTSLRDWGSYRALSQGFTLGYFRAFPPGTSGRGQFEHENGAVSYVPTGLRFLSWAIPGFHPGLFSCVPSGNFGAWSV